MARWPWQRRWPTTPLASDGSASTAFAASVTELTEPHEVTQPTPDNLTAAALSVGAIQSGRRGLVPQYESWQRELWDYYDSMGEFGYAVTWRANMVSRVRLRA